MSTQFCIEEMPEQGVWVLIGPLGTIVRMGTKAQMEEEQRRANVWNEDEDTPEVAAVKARVQAEHDLVVWQAVGYDWAAFLRSCDPHA
jgi:hypothetical protein